MNAHRTQKSACGKEAAKDDVATDKNLPFSASWCMRTLLIAFLLTFPPYRTKYD